jgi:hypothetical protein
VPQDADHQRAAAGPVNVVIGEDGNTLARLHGIRQPRRRRVHVAQDRRVGQQPAQGRLQEGRRGVDADAARRQQPPDQLRHAQALGQGRPQPGIAGAPHPAPPADAALDAERGLRHADLRVKLWCPST